jgi:hypothetical protein
MVFNPCVACRFVWFYGATTQFRSYGANTGNSGVTTFKATPGIKIIHLLLLRDA